MAKKKKTTKKAKKKTAPRKPKKQAKKAKSAPKLALKKAPKKKATRKRPRGKADSAELVGYQRKGLGSFTGGQAGDFSKRGRRSKRKPCPASRTPLIPTFPKSSPTKSRRTMFLGNTRTRTNWISGQHADRRYFRYSWPAPA